MRDTDFTGSIEFDVDRGITLTSRMETTMEMSVAAGGQEMTIGTTQTMRLELVEYVSGR